MTSHHRRARNELSKFDQNQVISLEGNGMSVSDIMKKMSIGKSTVYDILKRKHAVQKDVQDLGARISKKVFRVRNSGISELDKALLEWFSIIRSKKYPVSGPECGGRVRYFKEQGRTTAKTL